MKPLLEWVMEKMERHWFKPVASQSREVKRQSIRKVGTGWVGGAGSGHKGAKK